MDALFHLVFTVARWTGWCLVRLAVLVVGQGWIAGQWLAGWVDAHLVVRR